MAEYTRGPLTAKEFDLTTRVYDANGEFIASFLIPADAALFARAGRMYEILKRMDDLRTAKASIVTHEDFEELYKDAQALYAELSPMLSRDAGEEAK